MSGASTPPPPTAVSALPLDVHPTARALFDALDERQQQRKEESLSTSKTSDHIRKRTATDHIRKRTATLGWRNRYVQATDFPVSLRVPVSKHHQDYFKESPSNSVIQFSVRQVQRGEVEGTYGTGATVWPASIVLIKYLEHQAQIMSKNMLKNKSVVDLGAGTGVCSLAAAFLHAKRVVCTDGCEPVVRLAKDNVTRVCQIMDEGVPCAPITVKQYSWGDGSLSPERFGVVLVSDCVLPKLYPIEPLVKAIDELLDDISPDAMALLSYEHRYYPDYDPRDKFRELAAKYDLNVQIVPIEEQDPVYSVDDIEIWKVTRQGRECV